MRSKRFEIKFTFAEYTWIKRQAHKLDMPMAGYIRDCINDRKKREESPNDEL